MRVSLRHINRNTSDNMRNILIVSVLLLLMCATIPVLADGPLDGKTTVDDAHTLIYITLFLFAGSLAWMKFAEGVNVISIIAMGLSAFVCFQVANIYNNGTLVQVMPDSSVQIIHNASTAAIFQFSALVMMGLFLLLVFLIGFAKKKPIFIKDDMFGDMDD